MLVDIDIIDIQKLLNKKYTFYAHSKTEENLDYTEYETIQEHTNRCVNYFKNIVKVKNLEKVFENFERLWLSEFEEEHLEIFRKLLMHTIIFHDIGKINPLFQKDKMKNPLFQKWENYHKFGSNHSIISAIIYLEYFLSQSMNFSKNIRGKLRVITYVNAYVIARHHNSLGNFVEFIDAFYEESGEYRSYGNILREEYKELLAKEVNIFQNSYCNQTIKYVKKYLPTEKKDSMILYTYEKLLYSLLIASDYYATTEFNDSYLLESHGTIENIKEIMENYENAPIMQSIRKYERTDYQNDERNLASVKDINHLRSELFLDAEQVLRNHIDKNMFYLEAPTGSGKSNTALNLSFQLIKQCHGIQKIMYIYPFNTLVEQNLDTLKKIFGDKEGIFNNICVVNSVTPIKKQSENYDEDIKEYVRALLDRQFFNYPITLSTHVTLFNLMFGTEKESGFGFFQLANSVVVLDEIQSYKNSIWTEIISFLKIFAEVLNMKIIIMSATLPDLDLLAQGTDESIKLIENREKFFLHPLFKNRVRINYDLLDADDVIEEIIYLVRKNLNMDKKILIEFIKKQTAMKFYQRICRDDEINCQIELMTGDDNSVERSRIIQAINEEKEGIPFLLVATQVVEAGVDLKNVDVGLKDISILDAEEQFMGRINRSCEKDGIVYFFHYDEAKTIYENDVRISPDLTILADEMKGVLLSKNYGKFYKKVFEGIIRKNKSYDQNLNMESFFRQIGYLNAPHISNRLKLIEEKEWSYSVFLDYTITLPNGNILDGKEVWNAYMELLNKKNNNYAEWKVKLSQIKSKMNFFIYEVNKQCVPIHSEQLGELYLIPDGEQYFTNGKFDRKKLEEQRGFI